MAGPARVTPGSPNDATSDDEATRREVAAALKHDLGKYVAWRSANLDDAAWAGPLAELTAKSIRDDILATSRTGDAELAAWDVFDRLVARWPGPRPAELEATAAAIAELRTVEDALRADDRAAIADARALVRRAQVTIRRELAELARRLGRGPAGG